MKYIGKIANLQTGSITPIIDHDEVLKHEGVVAIEIAKELIKSDYIHLEDIAQYACDQTRMLFEEIRKSGWIIPIPEATEDWVNENFGRVAEIRDPEQRG